MTSRLRSCPKSMEVSRCISCEELGDVKITMKVCLLLHSCLALSLKMAPNQEIENTEKGESSSTEKMNTPSEEQKKLNNEQILTPEEAKLKLREERKLRHWTDWNNFAPGRQTGICQDYPKSVWDDVRWVARMYWTGLVNRILKIKPPGRRSGW